MYTLRNDTRDLVMLRFQKFKIMEKSTGRRKQGKYKTINNMRDWAD